MSYETILYEKKARIAHYPESTQNPQRLQRHHGRRTPAGAGFDQDDALHVLIISGAGRAFCSGADVKQRQLRPEEMKRIGGPAGGIKPAGGLLGIGQTVNWKPIIAAVTAMPWGLALPWPWRVT